MTLGTISILAINLNISLNVAFCRNFRNEPWLWKMHFLIILKKLRSRNNMQLGLVLVWRFSYCAVKVCLAILYDSHSPRARLQITSCKIRRQTLERLTLFDVFICGLNVEGRVPVLSTPRARAQNISFGKADFFDVFRYVHGDTAGLNGNDPYRTAEFHGFQRLCGEFDACSSIR